MIRICRTSTAILLAALIATPTTVFAAGSELDVRPASGLTYHGRPIAELPFASAGSFRPDALRDRVVAPVNSLGQRGYGHRRYHNDAAMTAILLGAAGAIAGSAVLVYANRPDCSANANVSGCGYGTKVVGGAVLSAGLVGLLVGALTWR